MYLTDRQQTLIRFIQELDKRRRHRIKILCRGTEPWEVEECSTVTKLELKPSTKDLKIR